MKKTRIGLVVLLLAGLVWAQSPQVSLDFNNAPLGQVLAELARQCNLTLQLDASLTGRVTIHLHKVTV